MQERLKRLVVLLLLAGLASCGRSPEQPPNVDVDIASQQGDARVAVVFIHGIMGSAAMTFRADGAAEGWPDLIAADKSIGVPIHVMSLAFASEPVSRASNIHEIATRLQTRISDKQIFDRFDKIVFVTHSMGGLIAKRMLLQLNRDSPSAYAKVAGIFFLATPAGGANLADLAAWISSNPQFKDMASEDMNTFLQTEEDDWAAMLRKRTEDAPYPKAFCVYEKLPVGPVIVVPRSRSQSGCDERPVAYDRNHINLVKPSGATDEVYEYVLARLRRIVRDEYVRLKVTIALQSPAGVPIGPGTPMRSGDQYALRVFSSKPAWFYVFAEDSRGKVERYFPSSATGQQESPTALLRVPTDASMAFTLDQNRGLEHITVVASSESDASLTKLEQEVGKSGASAAAVLSRELSKRGATVDLSRKPLPEETRQRIELASFGAEAGAALTFRHE